MNNFIVNYKLKLFCDDFMVITSVIRSSIFVLVNVTFLTRNYLWRKENLPIIFQIEKLKCQKLEIINIIMVLEWML